MISFIVPTIGRSSLGQAIRSIETQGDDQILVIGQPGDLADPRVQILTCPTGHNWGCLERTLGIAAATQPYLAFLDDDDCYVPGHRMLMADAIRKHPQRPVLFRMRYPNGVTLWREPHVVCGNVSSVMILIPNDPPRLGTWTGRREGDFDFLSSMHWTAPEIVWRTDIIALLGHDDALGAPHAA